MQILLRLSFTEDERRGVPIADRVAELVLGNDPGGIDLTEHTTRVAVLVAECDAAKVSVVAIPLGRVARIAKGLKIRDVVCPTFVTRDDMVDFKRLMLMRNAT
jgi:hypothetical protein